MGIRRQYTVELRDDAVELPKRDKSKPIEKLDKDEQWSYLIEEAHIATEEDMSRLANLRPEMREAVDHAAEISRDVQLKLRAISIEKAEGMRADREDYVRDQGLKQGHDAGHVIGRAEGRKEGLEQERQENEKMIALMLERGDIKDVARLTGLSVEKLQQIKNKV